MKLIVDGGSVLHPYASLMNQIRGFFAKDWNFKCVHIMREANQVADGLANLAHSLPVGTHLFEAPPPSRLSKLLFDRLGVTFPRSTLV